MKKLVVFFILVARMSFLQAQAQEHHAQLIKEPANWEFERFNLPPEFAPGITYRGAEELRFAPGMFNKDSSNYFTYIFVVQIDDVVAISQTEIHEYLLNYYRGLCRVTARDRKLTVDTTQIAVAVEKQKGLSPGESIFNATTKIFGVFADGAPVKLNMEVQVFLDKPRKRTYLFILASPLEKSDVIWKTLFGARKGFALPG